MSEKQPAYNNLYLWMISRYNKHKAAIHAGHVTFFLILSFFPCVMLMMKIFDQIPGSSEEKLLHILDALTPSPLHGVIEPVTSKFLEPTGGIYLFTIITLLWAGSKGLDGIAQGMDSIYGTRGKRGYVLRRACSLLYLVGFILMIVAGLALLVSGSMLYDFLEKNFDLPFSGFFIRIILQYGLSMCVFLAFFVILFRFCPYTPTETRAERIARLKDNRTKPRRERVRKPKYRTWKKELPGAVLTAVLWIVFSRLFSIYVHYRLAHPSYYGSLASVFLLLLWLYFCIMFIFIGALFNNYSYRTGESAIRHIIRDLPGLFQYISAPFKKKKKNDKEKEE